MDLLRTESYHITFLSRYPADKHLCADAVRWWPEWHKYYLDDSNLPVHGAHMIFSPKRKPDLTRYMLWTDSVYLTDTSCFFSWTI